MKKKLLIIVMILVAFIACGCDATYSVTIKDDKVVETLEADTTGVPEDRIQIFTTNVIPIDTNNESIEGFDEIGPNMDTEKVEGIKYYDFKRNGNILTTKATFNLSNYENSRLANQMFSMINVTQYDDYYSLYGHDNIQIFDTFPELDNLTVKITTDRKIRESDADKIEGNTYIWYFNKQSSPDKTVAIYTDTEQGRTTDSVIEERQKNKNIFIYVVIGVIILLFVGFMYIRIKNIKSNEI